MPLMSKAPALSALLVLLANVIFIEGHHVCHRIARRDPEIAKSNLRNIAQSHFEATYYNNSQLFPSTIGRGGNDTDADTSSAAYNESTVGLQEAYGPVYDMGVAILKPEEQLIGHQADIVDKNFKIVISDNFLTWKYVEPDEGHYDWERADLFVNWSMAHNKTIVGHTLLWNEDDWMVDDDDPDALLKTIETHIKTVVGRYKGKVNAWNVVNEFFDDSGNIRDDTVIPDVLGEKGIIKAFEYAHEADPEAELWLNEYHMYLPSKSTKVIEFVDKMRKKGVKIDGIGIQAHQYHTDESTGGSARAPTIDDFQRVLLECSAIGVKCWVTELDITVLPNKWSCCKGDDIDDYSDDVQEEYNPYVDGLPSDVEEVFTNRYRDFFAMTLDLPENTVQSVQLWGVADQYSWYNKRPIDGRTDYPLLWDRDLNPKPAVDAILALRGY